MTAQDVLDFWYSELSPDQWFRGGDAVDRLISERFSHLIDPVYMGEYEAWAETPTGRLALILVLDQFPRNLFRGQARSFAYDDKALKLALEGIELRSDETLSPHQRAFFYLPLEHSEDMVMQDLSVERYASLVVSVEQEARDKVRHYLDYAWQHYAIIKKFGRYPHRNEILGRETKPDEEVFLASPGSSF